MTLVHGSIRLNINFATIARSPVYRRYVFALMRLLFFCLFIGAAFAQDLACITEMAIPRYDLGARRSSVGGTVTAIVTIGPKGTIAKVDVTASESNLAEEVGLYLTKAAKYSVDCDGRRVEIKFTFRLEGEAEWNPPTFIRF